MIELDTVSSTNEYLKHYRPLQPKRVTLVTAECQTAGRGATGGWETAPGQNVIFSLLTHPTMVPATRMYVLSEIICLAVRDALDSFTPGFLIKWPNDIYYKDKKMVGILLENDLQGSTVSNCIMGVGVNVNQTTFTSDAPNPSSLALVLGHEVERRFVLERIMERFNHYYDMVEEGREADIHAEYLTHLYRKDEEAAYHDEHGDFRATLVDVEPDGHLLLKDEAGEMRRYAFKEVQFKI